MKTSYDVKLLNGSKQEVTYSGVEKVTLPAADGSGTKTFTAGEPLDGLEIPADFSGGDMALDAPAGNVVRSAVVKKPEGAEAVIAKGSTLAGIAGEYVTPGIRTEIVPDFSGGDQTVQAEGDTRWNEVTLKKPETLVPENIAKGVEVAGVVGAAEPQVMADRVVRLGLSVGGCYVSIGTSPISYLSMQGYIGVPSNATILSAAFSYAVNYSSTSKPTVYPSKGKHPFSSYYSGSYLIFEASASFSRSGSQNAAVLSGAVTYTLGKEAFFIETMPPVSSPMLGTYGAVSGWTTSMVHGYEANTYLNDTARAIRMNQYSARISSQAFANTYAVTIQHGDIVDNAFQSAYTLRAIRAVEASRIGSSAFDDCTGLEKVDTPNVTAIGGCAFRSCYSLKEIDTSALLNIPDSAFYCCSGLSMVSLPKVTTIGSYAFASCSGLQSLVLPEATAIGSYAFAYCSALSMVSLPKVTSIDNAGLYTDALRSVYLLGSVVPQLKYTYDLGYGLSRSGHIYVRQSMMDAFKASSLWSLYKSCIVGLTDDEIAKLEEQNGS